MKYSQNGVPDVDEMGHGYGARMSRNARHPAVGAVCPGCGARIGKSCVATVPSFDVAVGTPIEGVHVERIAAAREKGIA